MAVVKLDDVTIRSWIARAQRERIRLEVRDSKRVGLTLKCHPTGAATWSLTYRLKGQHKLARAGLGPYPILSLKEAREGARAFLAKVHLGGNPVEEIRKRAAKAKTDRTDTFDHLFNLWLDNHAKANVQSWVWEEQRHHRHIKPRIGARAFSSLLRKDFAEIRDKVAKASGPVESNRVVSLMNRVLHWAVDSGHIPFNPAARLKKASKETPRERSLSPAELKAVWSALDAMDAWCAQPATGARGRPMQPAMRIAIKLLVMTGQRRGEVIGAKLDELRLEADLPSWIIPRERTKNRLPHVVPLTRTAVALFEAAITLSHSKTVVFESDKTGAAIRPDAVTRAVKRLVAMINQTRADDQKMAPLGPHDLRRTAGTMLSQAGISKEHRARILNHVKGAKNQTATDIYDTHDYYTEKKAAMEVLEQRVLETVGAASAPSSLTVS